jgi:hypothetical protein
MKAAGSADEGDTERYKRGEVPSGADPTIDKSVRLAPCHSLAVAAKMLQDKLGVKAQVHPDHQQVLDQLKKDLDDSESAAKQMQKDMANSDLEVENIPGISKFERLMSRTLSRLNVTLSDISHRMAKQTFFQAEHSYMLAGNFCIW